MTGQCLVDKDRVARCALAQLQHDAGKRPVVRRAHGRRASSATSSGVSTIVRDNRRAIDEHVTRNARRRLLAEIVLEQIFARADIDVAEQVRVQPRAAARADVRVGIEVIRPADARERRTCQAAGL